MMQWSAILAPSAVCHLIHAYDVPYMERLRLCGIESTEIASCIEASKAHAETMIQTAISAADPAADIRVHLVRGEPLAAILTKIVEIGVQLLVVGKRDHQPGDSAHSLFGSIGVRLAYHAPVDVLLVPSEF